MVGSWNRLRRSWLWVAYGAVERDMICRLQIRASRKRALHHAFEHRDQRIGRHWVLKIRQTLFPSLGLQLVDGGPRPALRENE